jgi:hypothetical protein
MQRAFSSSVVNFPPSPLRLPPPLAVSVCPRLATVSCFPFFSHRRSGLGLLSFPRRRTLLFHPNQLLSHAPLLSTSPVPPATRRTSFRRDAVVHSYSRTLPAVLLVLLPSLSPRPFKITDFLLPPLHQLDTPHQRLYQAHRRPLCTFGNQRDFQGGTHTAGRGRRELEKG